MNNLKWPSEKGLTLPDVFQHWALLLALQSNETILQVMKWGGSTEWKSPRWSVLDRPTPTADERRRRFAQRKKFRQLWKPWDKGAQEDENLLANQVQ